MHPKLVGALRPDGERQTLEFKTSLNERREIIQTAVAFANAQGGDIFVGINPNGTPVGLDVADQTVEQFINQMRQQIYPPLQFHVDQVPPSDELGCSKPLLWIEVPRDTPPIVGAYLAAGSAIPRDKPVAIDKLQAYRRVGRTNQKVDFMWLRPRLPSDPRLYIGYVGGSRGGPGLTELTVTVWADLGSGTARDVRCRTDSPPTVGSPWSPFLPRSDKVNSMNVTFRFETDQPAEESVKAIVSCLDDWGCRWEFSHRFDIVHEGTGVVDIQAGTTFSRRIVEFPAMIGGGLM